MSRGMCRIALVLACGFSMAAQALTPAQQLVEKMAVSARQLSYKGYFYHERGQQSSSYQIVHQVDGDVERQRLVFLDGPAREIISDGHSLKCLHSGDARIPQDDVVPAMQLEITPLEAQGTSLQSIWQNYAVTIAGSTRVANRSVTRVQLDPRDLHRYPYVFFVDDETGLMLKMQVLDAQGKLLERFHFVQLEVGPVHDRELVPQISDYVAVEHPTVAEAGKGNADSGWHLAWVPNGFRKDTARMAKSQPEARGRQIYMYSDGLSSFSVFVEPATLPDLVDTSTQLGSTSAVSHVMKIRGAKFMVTVVGEIPIMTAKQIALSVEPAS